MMHLDNIAMYVKADIAISLLGIQHDQTVSSMFTNGCEWIGFERRVL